MYVSTYGGLGQVPRLHGSFAENTSVSSPLFKKFLDKVRKRPQDFKKLLLTVTFHPAPVESKIANRNQPPFVDMILMDGIQPVALLNPLRRIRDELQKRDSRFKQQIEAELQLRNE